MPFYYRRKWNNNYFRRRRYRRRGPRKTFRRKRRQRRVRRKRFKKYRLRKLKTIIQRQYQPEQIRKCKIRGFLELIECGYGRLSDNWALYKESYAPEHEPGGGGWSIQQLTLGNLYIQSKYAMNYWTHTNRGYNLARYLGVNIRLYRQPQTDYIFHYNLQDPQIITKYTYPSYHPYKILQYHQRIVVPSLQTAPHKKKLYKQRFIKPPKKMKNQWYFQEQLTDFPLLTFYTTAVDLQSMFISPKAQNNNITLNVLNTQLFHNPNFQFPPETSGYKPDSQNYLYGYTGPHIHWPNEGVPLKNFILLADTTNNTPGEPILNNSMPPKKKWGNPFFHEFFNMDAATTLQSIKPGDKAFAEKNIKESDLKVQPYYEQVRYNPNKDDGDGNEAYIIKNFTSAQQPNWDPPKDEDLILRGHPLWLMLWGLQSYIEKKKLFNDLDKNGILVIRTKKFSGPPLPAYVILNDSFCRGQGPYDQPREEITLYNNTHWYPRFKYQKEALEQILETGPGVYKTNRGTSIQSHLHYTFLFKWGGNPSKMETIADPTTQPTGPDPNNLLFSNEINSPEQTILNYIYKWDVRRDLLTQKATNRITELQIPKQTVFTDGKATSTDIPIWTQTTPQTKETTEEENQEIQQQLELVQLYNQQLQQRLRQLILSNNP